MNTADAKETPARDSTTALADHSLGLRHLMSLDPTPIDSAPLKAEPSAPDPARPSMIPQATFLIVDDEVANVRLLERILQRANCRQVICTSDSREAKTLFEKHEPDLVLTDWLMPHYDGCAVIEQIHAQIGSDDYLPIVVLTADVTQTTRRRALAAGATDFLTKPFDQFEVLLRIENLLETRFAHRKLQEQNAGLESHVRERTIDLERALNELQEAQRQVVQQERLAALGTMAGGIAHDFNNALSVIMGFGELLLTDAEDGLTKAQALKPLTTIMTAAEDASKIVGRLREFYRPDEADEIRVRVDLNEVVEQAISLTKPRWETQSRADGRPVDVEAKLCETACVSGDPAALREALTNLIFNAVDAMPEGGNLTLRTIAKEKDVVIEIADNGTGMTDEVRERCLEPFFTTKGVNGTGLGLAMVFGIVQRHSGTVDLVTTPGKGTTFRLRFPAAEGPSETGTETAHTLHRPLHILVVDDQPVLCQVLRDYLIYDLHSVETSGDPYEALETFRKEKFDLVITDQVMAGMNGVQLATEMKIHAPAVPVILLTGFGNDSLSSESGAEAIDLVVGKPLLRSALRHAIATVLSRAGGRHRDRMPAA